MNQRTIAVTAAAYDNAYSNTWCYCAECDHPHRHCAKHGIYGDSECPGCNQYPAFVQETLAQAESLVGLTVIPVNLTEPYSTSRELFRDIDHGRIKVNAIDPLAPGHPLAARYRVGAWGLTLSANVIFRIVHDVLGHHNTGQPFETFLGEYHAYQAHARQYVSPDALAVLHSETLGQLAAFYAGAGFQPLQHPKVIL